LAAYRALKEPPLTIDVMAGFPKAARPESASKTARAAMVFILGDAFLGDGAPLGFFLALVFRCPFRKCMLAGVAYSRPKRTIHDRSGTAQAVKTWRSLADPANFK
jgi:hypothetical protein